MEVVVEYGALRQLLQERCPGSRFSDSDIKNLWDAGFDSEAAFEAARRESLTSTLPGRPGNVAVLLRTFAQSEATAALSFSIAEQNVDMTYELENVRCVASATVVAALPVCCFKKEQATGFDQASEVCIICQGDYEPGDSQVKLPCQHAFHQACGVEWLLNYSKLCPICKHTISQMRQLWHPHLCS